ncbi:SpoIIE family protein phosphatase [Phormidium tenue FACHB-886]|nr:SpoIIE family protein phosphatase [Phormidium tenue FACHB-886]
MSKILVIDDDPLIRVVIQRALQNQGHEVTLAADGQEGIAKAQAVQPALIVCDWMMPAVDGLTVCRRLKANPELCTTFFILLTSRDGIADRVRGLNTGADDFLSKPIDIAELQARVRAGLRLHQLNQDLQMQKQRLEAELAEAAAYVTALLPAPLSGAISIEARFIPSSQLGGDCFDYFWLDEDHLAFYLLDVSGHGLGAALPSIMVLNLLRSRSLPNVDFRDPGSVLLGLNDRFQMSGQNEKYFTIWYGVYRPADRQLTYASAGHPPAVLIAPNQFDAALQLRTPCLPIGMMTDATFTSACLTIPAESVLYIYSDGIYELNQPSSTWGLDSFIELLVSLDSKTSLDAVLAKIQAESDVQTFNDDLSLLRVCFRNQTPG